MTKPQMSLKTFAVRSTKPVDEMVVWHSIATCRRDVQNLLSSATVVRGQTAKAVLLALTVAGVAMAEQPTGPRTLENLLTGPEADSATTSGTTAAGSFPVAAQPPSSQSVQQSPPTPLPAATKKILDDAIAEVKRNRKPYDEANKQTLDRAEGRLREELDRWTQAGKLDEALATRELIKTFRSQVLSATDVEKKIDDSGDDPTFRKLAGKWAEEPSSIWIISKDGRIEILRAVGEGVGRYRLRVGPDGVAEFRWGSGGTCRLVMTGANALSGIQGKGPAIKLRRLE